MGAEHGSRIPPVPADSHSAHVHGVVPALVAETTIRVKDGEVENRPGQMLMMEYFKMNFGVERVWSSSLMNCFFDCLHYLYYLITVYMNFNIMDELFSDEHEAQEKPLIPGARPFTAWIVAALYVVPFAFLHFWDFKRAKLDLTGVHELYGALPHSNQDGGRGGGRSFHEA